tara:strand:- start:8364 stop:8690 length:327 start_codon:yes stop_codon:yes gene_type:complete
MSFYKFSDNHTGIRIIGVIEFDDNEHYDNFIAQVSELLWGDCGSYEDANGDTVCPREPYSVEESLARLREFSDKALAWDNMVEAHSSDSENDWVITELMDDILKEVKQ